MATAQTDYLAKAPGGMTGPVRILRARALDEVDALAPMWRQMHCRAASPIGQFAWVRACLSAFPDEAAPCVVAGLTGERMVALAPLVKRRLRGVCRLFLAGVEELFEATDLAWSDERALARLIRSLARHGTPLVFERMPADSASVRQLKRAYRGRAIVVLDARAGCSRIALDESWIEPERHLRGEVRRALSEGRRSAEARGETTIEIRAPDLGDLGELMDVVLELETRGRGPTAKESFDERVAQTRGPMAPPASDARRAVFYRQYARAACLEGTLRVCFLRIGGHPAAVQLAVEHAGALWLLCSAYDARVADCSPALLLARETIRYASEAGLASYEFLSTSEEWSAPWRTSVRRCVAVRVYPLGVRGLAALAADVGVAQIERWRNAVGVARPRVEYEPQVCSS